MTRPAVAKTSGAVAIDWPIVVELRFRDDFGVKMLLIAVASGYLGAILGASLVDELLLGRQVMLWFGWLGLAILALVVVLGRLWQPVRLEFDGSSLTEIGRFRRHTAAIGELRRLAVIDIGGRYRALSIETVGGRQMHFLFDSRRAPAALDTLVTAVAERSGLIWHGLDVPSAVSGRASWSELIGAWRDIAGLHTRRQMLLWLVGHVLWPRVDRVALNDAFLHRGVQLFALGLMTACAPVLLLELGMVRDWRPEDLLLPTVGVLAVAWMTACLGVNLLLIFARGESRTREGLEADLQAAREVQRRLLPAAPPDIEGMTLSGSCEPAREVGGDYFDYLDSPSTDELVRVVVADVAGKGLAAAMLATFVKGALGAALDGGAGLDEAALAVGRQIRTVRRDRRFVSLVLAELDAISGRLRLVRAGHPPPLVVRADGRSEWLEPAGTVLGLGRRGLLRETCELIEIALEPGDAVIFYSDGVTEAQNDERDELGTERLSAAAVRAAGEQPATIRRAVLDAVERFRAGAPASDDVTVVVLGLDRVAEDRAADDGVAEDRTADDRAAGDRAADDRAAEDGAAVDGIAVEDHAPAA